MLKPSGVEWLGEVPEHWELSQLGLKNGCVLSQGGSAEQRKTEVKGGLPCDTLQLRTDLYYPAAHFLIRSSRTGIAEATASPEEIYKFKLCYRRHVLFAKDSGETIDRNRQVPAVNLIQGADAYCVWLRPVHHPFRSIYADTDATFFVYATDCSSLPLNQKASSMGRLA